MSYSPKEADHDLPPTGPTTLLSTCILMAIVAD